MHSFRAHDAPPTSLPRGVRRRWPLLTHTPGLNVNVLRSVRALRPLKFVRFVPGMPVLVNTILGVVPKMGNVAMLCAFLFLVCGIVGIELFKGALHQRCAAPGFSSSAPAAVQSEYDAELLEHAPRACIHMCIRLTASGWSRAT